MPPTELRLAVEADLDLVQRITRDAYAAWEAVLGGPPVPVTEDYRPRIARGDVWLVLRSGAGVAVLAVDWDPDALIVFSLAVPPAHQGQGLGRAMLQHAERLGRAAGRPVLRLFTADRMERNIATYLRLGFVETGRRPNPYRPGWTLVDMARPISPPGART